MWESAAAPLLQLDSIPAAPTSPAVFRPSGPRPAICRWRKTSRDQKKKQNPELKAMSDEE
jgi:hypothetical protein